MSGLLRQKTRQIKQNYQGDKERPLGGYLTVLGVYGGLTGALVALAKALGKAAPTLGLQDISLLSVATHKLSRVLSKDAVTSPLRAPFTHYEKPTGEGELMESVPREGAPHATGELLTCPFCLGMWVATGLAAGMVFAPKFTRLICSTLTAVAVSDGLHLAYDAAKRRTARA